MRRRQRKAHRDVVESYIALIGQQRAAGVERDAEQIANGVAVLGAIQPMRADATWIRMRRGGSIERVGNVRDHAAKIGGLWSSYVCRRHLPGAQLLKNLLPQLGLRDRISHRR